MTMSKPFIKVTLAILLTLILILAIYTSVQGAWLNAGTRIGQSHVDAGLNANLSHSRTAGAAQLSSFEAQLDAYKQDGGGHGCESEHSNPSDY